MFKDFFSWSKNERSGIMLLSGLLFFLILGDLFFNNIFQKEAYIIQADSLQYFSEILMELEEENKKTAKTTSGNLTVNEKNLAKEKFDPNRLDLKGWMELGFSEKQSKSLISYKQSLGAFKNKEELKNSYVISEDKFKQLESRINIEKLDKEFGPSIKDKNTNEEAHIEKKEKKRYLDLNVCDSISLLELKGIGPFYAGKIIAYRKELGGYVEKEQLLEIWKFDADKLNLIWDQIYISDPALIPLNINTDSINLLQKHPYIRWNLAKAIVNFRKQHGDYIHIEDLNQMEMMNDSLFNKLYPYLTLE